MLGKHVNVLRTRGTGSTVIRLQLLKRTFTPFIVLSSFPFFFFKKKKEKKKMYIVKKNLVNI